MESREILALKSSYMQPETTVGAREAMKGPARARFSAQGGRREKVPFRFQRIRSATAAGAWARYFSFIRLDGAGLVGRLNRFPSSAVFDAFFAKIGPI